MIQPTSMTRSFSVSDIFKSCNHGTELQPRSSWLFATLFVIFIVGSDSFSCNRKPRNLIIKCQRPSQTLLSVSLQQRSGADTGDDVVEILQGKLTVLEQVVTELNRRQKDQLVLEEERQKAATAQQNEAEEQYQAEIQKLGLELEEAKLQGKEIKDDFDKIQESLKAQKQEYDEEIRGLKERLTVKNREERERADSKTQEQLEQLDARHHKKTEKLRLQLEDKEEEMTVMKESFESEKLRQADKIAVLTKHLADSVMQKDKALSELRSELGAEQSQQDQEIQAELSKLQAQLRERTTQIQSLEKELSEATKTPIETGPSPEEIEKIVNDAKDSAKADVKSELEERITIATAAVTVAEQREKDAIKKLEKSKEQLQQAQLQVKIQQYTIKMMEESEIEYDEEIDYLRDALTDARAKVKAMQEYTMQSTSTSSQGGGVWKRMRTAVRKPRP